MMDDLCGLYCAKSSSLSRRPAINRFAAAALALLSCACGGRAPSSDPLASIAAEVRDEDRSPPPLAEAWTRRPPTPLTFRPAVDDRNVYLALGDELAAWSVVDGQPAWRVPLDSPISAPPVMSGAHVVVGTDGTSASPPRIWWISADGDVSTVRPLEHPIDGLAGAPGTVVYIDPGGIGRVDAPDGTGAQLGHGWRVDFPGASTIEVSSGLALVFATTSDGRLVALDIESGAERWSYESAGEELTRPALGGDAIYVGTSGGLVAALRARDGSLRWERPLGVGIVGAPAAVDRLLWIAGLDAKLRAMNAGNGTLLHTLELRSRNYLDMASFGEWIIVGPRYGPWLGVRAPLRSERVGRPVQVEARASDLDLRIPAGSGPAGVAVVNGDGRVIFMQRQQGRAR